MLKRLAAATLLASIVLVADRPAFAPSPPVTAQSWTPAEWTARPTSAPAGKSVCFFPDFATAGEWGVGSPNVTTRVTEVECWPVDRDGHPYGRFYQPKTV